MKSAKRNHQAIRFTMRYVILAAAVLILEATIYTTVKAGTGNAPYYFFNINVQIYILLNSDMEITETQEVIFRSGEYHFMYRWIPMERVDSISNIEVSEKMFEVSENMLDYQENWRVMSWIEERKKKGGSPGGDTYAFTNWDEGKRFWIGWWYPKTTGGNRIFIIKYTVKGGIGIYEQGDQLYWKAIYKDRDVPIMNSKVTVHFPVHLSSDNLKIETYGIPADSYIVDSQKLVFETGPILPREELEIRVIYPHGIINAAKPNWQKNSGILGWSIPHEFLGFVFFFLFGIIVLIIGLKAGWIPSDTDGWGGGDGGGGGGGGGGGAG